LQVPVSFDVTARTSCIRNLPVQCNPPSGSLFPLGTTFVQCVAINNGQFASCFFPVNVCSVRITRPAPGLAVFTWSVGGVLEHATAVTGPWTPLLNATSPYQITIDPNKPSEFFRIRY
jgi:hypothetical protein